VVDAPESKIEIGGIEKGLAASIEANSEQVLRNQIAEAV